MTAYTASFANGRTFTIRNSKRDYGFAFHYTAIQSNGIAQEGHGFARTAELARKAMDSATAYLRVAPVVRSGPINYVVAMRKLRAEWKPGQITFSAVVPVARPAREEIIPTGEASRPGPALLDAVLNGRA